CERLETPMSPVQYLHAAFRVAPPGELVDPDSASSLLSTARVAGQPGVLVTVRGAAMPTDPRLGLMLSRDLYVCAVLPSLRAIVVHLHGIGEPSRQDTSI